MRFRAALAVSVAIILLALVSGPVNGQTTMFSFGGTNHGAVPSGGALALSPDGKTLYGMTTSGGVNFNYGTVFSIPTNGGTPSILFSFDFVHGANPYGGLTLSSDGSTLYGMTCAGGARGLGTVFRISTTGGMPLILCSFSGSNGSSPHGSLTLLGSTLYGMTSNGGAHESGTIFSVNSTTGSQTILFSFDNTNGAFPYGSLSYYGGLLYGMTQFGGTNGKGTIFSVPISGGTPWGLCSFNGTNGANPNGSLTFVGSIPYGMTTTGGATGQGTIFSGFGASTLFSFDGTHGSNPYGDLTFCPATGLLYGMTANGGANQKGTIFSISLGGGTPTTMFSFEGTHGANPSGNLTLGGTLNNSPLYGMAAYGGNNNDGTIFNIPAACILTKVVNPNGTGSVTVTPNQSPFLTNSEYLPNSVVNIQANPNPYYGFVSWSVTGGSVANATSSSTSLTITGSTCNLKASFTTCSLTVTESSGGTSDGGSVTVTPSQTAYAPGTVVTILANPYQYYGFVSWTVTGGSVANATSSSTSLTITGNCTLTASFTGPIYSGTETATTGNAGGGGTIIPSNSGPYSYGQVITATASAQSGYVFSRWSVSGSVTLSNSTTLTTSLTIFSNFMLTAWFSRVQYTMTTQVSPPEGPGNSGAGSVAVWPDGPYSGGQQVQLVATANSGYVFGSWTVSGNGTLGNVFAATTTLSVTGNCVVTANFLLVTVKYTVTDLGTLGGMYSSANGINNEGQVVGTATISGDSATHAFLYSSGSMADLGTLGWPYSNANGINNAGQVVGQATATAFLYSSGSMTDLGSLGGTFSSYACGINDAGKVVGAADTNSDADTAFLYSSGSMTDLGTLGGAWSYAAGINNTGQVVGTAQITGSTYATHAFLYLTGSMTDLGTLPGGMNSEAKGINNAGQIVGQADTGSFTDSTERTAITHAFLYSNGVMGDLGVLPDGTGSVACGINNAGQVVGSVESYFNTSTGVGTGKSGLYPARAFIYSNGTMTDLNSLIAPSSSWTLQEATAINDAGQIVGYGLDPNGYITAFLLTPILTIAAALDNSWVYQNTAATTQDRQSRTLTISVPQDSWPDQTFTVTVSQDGSGVVVPSQTFVDSTGSGAVTPTSSFTFTVSSATLYLVGGRRTDGVTGTGVCTVTIQVYGDVSQAANAATAQVALVVRPLGDINNDGSATTADRVQLMMRFNGLPTPNQTDADFDLDGDGAVTANDLTILNAMLNNLPVP